MIRIPLKAVAALSWVILLGACVAGTPTESTPQMTFRHLAPIALQVVDIQMVTNAPIRTQPPHVAHKFPVTPSHALIRWAEDRLQIAGNSRTARFTILQADVTETKLKVDKNLSGLFKKEQSERYDAVIEASLEIFDDRGIRRAKVTSKANWSRTVREDASLADRRRVWFVIVEKLMNEFNSKMESNIQRHMTEFLL